MPPRGGLNCTVSSCRTSCLIVEILVAFSLHPVGELLYPSGELNFLTVFRSYDRASCIFLFPGGLVTKFLLSSVRQFCRLIDFSPWKNLSWWFRRYDRTFLPTLQSDFIDLLKLVVKFHLLRLLALLQPS